MSIKISEFIDKIPKSPGVYLFKDRAGRVLYVGKAKDLRNRIKSYSRVSNNTSTKLWHLLNKASDFEYIITDTEKEAFILERNLIKEHMPRYNVVLRDDKQYPWLKLSLNERFPSIKIVRKPAKDGALYFGPYSSSGAIRKTLNLIEKIFNLRKCRSPSPPKRSRPCLNFQMNRCLGPCVNPVSHESYMESVNQVRLFLEGKSCELVKKLKEKMEQSARELNFEMAAKLRDQIHAIEKSMEKQNVISSRMEDMDAIACLQVNHTYFIVILTIREGKLISTMDFRIKYRWGNASEVMGAFIKQFYINQSFIPELIITSKEPEDEKSIGNWLSSIKGHRVRIIRPKRGEKLRIIKLAIKNAIELSRKESISPNTDILQKLNTSLGLKGMPSIIECVDISVIGGKIGVGAIVCFKDGAPMKSGYRNYKIKTVKGIDDYAMIKEVLERRISKGNLPNLIVIDGGRGHLETALNIINKKVPVSPPDVIAIAKAEPKAGEKIDKIYIKGQKNPILLSQNDPVLLFLMKVRDTAHRRAISYSRKLKNKEMRDSFLDNIKGIGPKRKSELLKRFGTIDGILKASLEEISQVPGITYKMALKIKEQLNELI